MIFRIASNERQQHRFEIRAAENAAHRCSSSFGDHAVMKRALIVLFLLMGVCGIGFGSYFLGFKRGYHQALILQNGTFVASLDAIEKLRVGDVKAGTERVEAMCFASANIVYGDFVSRNSWMGNFVGKSMLDDLQRYRRTYRTNSAEWTPMERSLENNLAKWK